ncbi:uncharacterized protein TRIADDRAFT_1836, partial [Trichoplax adhaerens]
QLIVSTTAGSVSGKIVNTNGTDQFAYLGIPYAQPPVGQLRFKPPVPKEQWSSVLNATEYQKDCSQPNLVGPLSQNSHKIQVSEDCLYLNIFTPNPSKAGNMSVLVWIHGGGFLYGTGAWWQGQILSANENIVVVTINYRLGIFGFMTSGEKDANQRTIPANLALQDQNLALKWVRENIENFGGNKDQITIAGNSAGAVAVSNHLVMPSSKGLFSRAIIQSGIFGDFPSYQKAKLTTEFTLSDAKNFFVQYSTVARCYKNITTETVNCLRTLPAQQLVQLQLRFLGTNPYSPIVDGDILPESSYKAIISGKFNKADIMIGTMLNDGYFFLLLMPNISQGLSQNQFKNYVNGNFPAANQRVKLSIQYQYTNWANVSSPSINRDQYGDMLNDYRFSVPNENYADALSRYVPTYTYIFAHRTAGTAMPSFAKAVHTIEIPYVFGYPLDPPANFPDKFDDTDRQVCRQVMAYWGNFIRQGNPSDLSSSPAWPRYRETSKDYMWIAPKLAIAKNYYSKPFAFWNQYLPQLATLTNTNTP